MTVIFTSLGYGGILQFANEIANQLAKIGEDTILYIPNNYVSSSISFSKIKTYDLGKNYVEKILKSKKLAKEINNNENIDLIINVDDTIFSNNLFINLKKKKCVVIHDPKNHNYNFSFKKNIRIFYLTIQRKNICDCANKVIVLSKNSANILKSKYKISEEKIFVLPLGPHVPLVEKKVPNELTCFDSKYILFFGNLVKYKNLEGFLPIFNKFCLKENNCDLFLLIAGNGNLNKSEINMINTNSKIKLINRFISDEEMIYLFDNKNCISLILPYSEATQSGVLSMGYFFGKPSIVSNVDGLSEFVINNKTGFICDDNDDYIEALKKVLVVDLSSECLNYFNNELSYRYNLLRLMKEVK